MDWSDPAGFVSGVPVKISENFRPPRKVKLPPSCFYKINTDVLTDEYDFTLERNITKWIADRKEFKETSRSERKQRILKYEVDKKERLEKLREQELEQERIAKEEALERERIAKEEALERERIEREEQEERERLAKEQELKKQEEEQQKAIEDEMRRLEEIEKQRSIKQAVENNTPNGVSDILETTEIIKTLTIENPEPSIQQTITPENPSLYDQTPKEMPCNGIISYPNHIPTTSIPINSMNHIFSPQSGQPKVPQASPGYLKPTPVNSSTNNVGSPGGAPINFAEFEATSDPFDTVALKSINDMEELAKVWQANQTQNQENQFLGYSQYPNRIYQYGTPTSYNNPTYAIQNPVNPTQKSQNSSQNSTSTNNGTPAISSYQSYANNPIYSYQPTMPVPAYLSNNVSHPPINKRQDLEDFYSKYYSQKKNKSGPRSGGATPTASETKSLRSCNSVPDLTSAEDVEVEQLTTGNKQNPICNSRPASTHLPGSLNSSFSETNSSSSKLSDPFNELSPDAQILVQNVSEMGFSRPRVARAVQKLGIDHKKLIEVLLALQDFQDAGNDEYLSEKSFYFYMGDLPKVTEFLASAKQLLSFGFPEERVADILFKHQNDQEKALEELIT